MLKTVLETFRNSGGNSCLLLSVVVILRLLINNNKIEDKQILSQLGTFVDSLLVGETLDLLCALHLILLKCSLNEPKSLDKKTVEKVLKTLYGNKAIAANVDRVRLAEECKEDRVFNEKLLDLSERFSLRYKVLNITFQSEGLDKNEQNSLVGPIKAINEKLVKIR